MSITKKVMIGFGVSVLIGIAVSAGDSPSAEVPVTVPVVATTTTMPPMDMEDMDHSEHEEEEVTTTTVVVEEESHGEEGHHDEEEGLEGLELQLREEAFILTMKAELPDLTHMSDEEWLEVGYIACDVMDTYKDSGLTIGDYLLGLAVTFEDDPDMAITIAGVSGGAATLLCPELSEWIDTNAVDHDDDHVDA